MTEKYFLLRTVKYSKLIVYNQLYFMSINNYRKECIIIMAKNLLIGFYVGFYVSYTFYYLKVYVSKLNEVIT